MSDFLIVAATLVLAIIAVGLWRVLQGPSPADRLMAVQLLGTGSVAALLLLSQTAPMPGVVDVALVLALLAAFVSVALVEASAHSTQAGGER